MGDTTQFSIGEEVTAQQGSIHGTVNAIFIDSNGTQYQVAYMDRNGILHRDYFNPAQLEGKLPF